MWISASEKWVNTVRWKYKKKCKRSCAKWLNFQVPWCNGAEWCHIKQKPMEHQLCSNVSIRCVRISIKYCTICVCMHAVCRLIPALPHGHSEHMCWVSERIKMNHSYRFRLVQQLMRIRRGEIIHCGNIEASRAMVKMQCYDRMPTIGERLPSIMFIVAASHFRHMNLCNMVRNPSLERFPTVLF